MTQATILTRLPKVKRTTPATKVLDKLKISNIHSGEMEQEDKKS